MKHLSLLLFILLGIVRLTAQYEYQPDAIGFSILVDKLLTKGLSPNALAKTMPTEHLGRSRATALSLDAMNATLELLAASI